MKRAAKITSKGQITVPREVRQALGVRAGDSLIFEESGGEIRVIPHRSQSAFGRYRGIGNPQLASGKRAIVDFIRELRGE